MADYSRYGIPSPEWQQFTTSNVLVPTGLAPDQSIEDLQRATNTAREKAAAQYLLESGVKKNITFEDFKIPTQDGQTISARVYRPKSLPENDSSPLPVYLFFHGGGFLFGTLSSEDASCGRIVAALNIVVVNVCYRHTPHYKHPTQASDAWDAFQWVRSHFDTIGGDRNRLIVGGVSAGGSLASSVVLRENKTSLGSGEKGIKGQVLCIPQLLLPGTLPVHLLASEEVGSYSQYIDAPVIPRTQLDLFASILDVKDPKDTSFFVGNCAEEDVMGMPKSAIIVAGMDPLRDEGLLYADKLLKNGVLTKVHVFKGLPHGFYRYASLPATDLWFAMIVESIKWILNDGEVTSVRSES